MRHLAWPPVPPTLCLRCPSATPKIGVGGRNRITNMAFLRKRASGNYSLSFKWKGKSYIKALGTDDEQAANAIKQDAEDQIARIRSGESALASKLLADGHSIVDVLFGSEEIGHLLASPADENPLTISQLNARSRRGDPNSSGPLHPSTW